MHDACPGPDRSRPILVCFSHLRWNFVFQRPQHLMTRAAASHDVVFVEEPEFAPVPGPVLRLVADSGVTVATPVLPESLYHADPAPTVRPLVAELVARARGRRVFWYYTPMALRVSDPTDADVVVYDNMDELSAFKDPPPGLLESEEALFAAADLVFTGGRSLYEAKRGRHRAVHCFPSSIDRAHFARARRPPPEPADLAGIARPRVGFFGVIDERLDADLLASLADLRPDLRFVMIGPVVKIDPESLPRRPNLHWLGPKSYAELPAYLGRWDAGIMPFALNEATRFISPTKTPEFLAAGLPVVCTPIRDVVSPYGEKGLVRIAEGPAAFARAIDAALAGRDDEAWRAAVDRHLAEGSWDGTWEAMRRLIEAAAGSRAAAAPGSDARRVASA